MVASEKATIGLNEAKFGLVAPFWFMDSFRNVTGQRVAEFALLNGKLYSVRDAKDIGKDFFWNIVLTNDSLRKVFRHDQANLR